MITVHTLSDSPDIKVEREKKGRTGDVVSIQFDDYGNETVIIMLSPEHMEKIISQYQKLKK